MSIERWTLTEEGRVIVAKLTAMRERMNCKSTRRLSNHPKGGDWIGVVGEVLFALRFGLTINLEDRPGGDGGIDFTVWHNGFKYTIDVKTAQKPTWLPIKEKDIETCADIVVMLQYHDDDSVTLIGWQTNTKMATCEKRNLRPEITSFCCPSEKLRRKDQLVNFLDGRNDEKPDHRKAIAPPSRPLRDGQAQALQVSLRR